MSYACTVHIIKQGMQSVVGWLGIRYVNLEETKSEHGFKVKTKMALSLQQKHKVICKYWLTVSLQMRISKSKDLK